jgi:phage-related protein
VQDARQITIEGRIQETSDIAARTTLSSLLELFSRQNKRLTLWDDRYINAYKAQLGYEYVEGANMCVIDFTITFFCPDPFWYNTTDVSQGFILTPNLQTSDILIDFTNSLYKIAPTTISVSGTFVAYPIWSINATSVPIHFATVRNLTTGRQFTYTGTILPGKALVVDTANFTVKNDGIDDLTHWSGDFVWLTPDPGGNSLQWEGTAPAAYSWIYTPRTY